VNDPSGATVLAAGFFRRKVCHAFCNPDFRCHSGLCCSTDRLAKRLRLTDAQKATLKDFIDASASADASTKKALCADKPDFSTAPGRMVFAEKTAETRVASLKAVEPKLQAFYDSLNARQKKAFDTGGRVGGIFDWWDKK